MFNILNGANPVGGLTYGTNGHLNGMAAQAGGGNFEMPLQIFYRKGRWLDGNRVQ